MKEKKCQHILPGVNTIRSEELGTSAVDEKVGNDAKPEQWSDAKEPAEIKIECRPRLCPATQMQ